MSEKVVEPVTGLRAQPVIGSTDVLLTWDRPASTGVLSSSLYKVFRKEVSGEGDWTRVAEEKDLFTCRISRLKPYTDYEFKVQRLGIVSGLGPESAPVATKTNPAAPGDAPANFRVTAVGNDAITLAWDPPPRTYGPLTSYHLFYDQDEADDYTEAILAPGTTTYVANFLYPGTSYRFQVFASSSAGEGPHSPILVCATRARIASMLSPSTTLPGSSPSTALVDGSISGRGQVQVDLAYDEDQKKHSLPLKQSSTFSIVAPAQTRKQEQPPFSSPSANQSKEPIALGSLPLEEEHVENPEEGQRLETSSNSQNVRGRGARRQPSFCAVAPNKSSAMSTQGARQMEKLRNAFERQMGDESQGNGKWTDSMRLRYRQEHSRASILTAGQLSKGVHVPQNVGAVLQADDILVSIQDGTKTIRGKRNGVRSKLEVYTNLGEKLADDELAHLYEKERDGCIVIYISSVEAIRETKAKCQEIKKLFHNMRLKVTYKDISLDAKTRSEFRKRCGEDAVVPQVFVNGLHLGSYESVQRMNEAGELRPILQGFEEAPQQACQTCAGHGFVPCTWCQGSKRSIKNPFVGKEGSNNVLKCTVCNEIGLMRCPQC